MSGKQPDQGHVSRRGFLQSSAVAAGGLAAVAGPAVAVNALDARAGATAASHAPAVPTRPSGPAPAEPVMAYLRNAATSEVTVMSGTSETTYKDPVLAQRLLDAARPVMNAGGN